MESHGLLAPSAKTGAPRSFVQREELAIHLQPSARKGPSNMQVLP
jgi:hypothetical protein